MSRTTNPGRPEAPPRLIGFLALFPLLAFAFACDAGTRGEEESETISRETFISAYVDLRLTALQDTARDVPHEERDRILERHGATADDLLQFIEVHGDEPEFIEEVWAEVDERIRDRAREPEDVGA